MRAAHLTLRSFVILSAGLAVLLWVGCQGAGGCQQTEDQNFGPPAASDTVIYGRVLSAVEDAPLAGVGVTVARVIGRVETDAQGRFAFPVPGAGTYDLTANLPGYTYAQRRATLAQAELASVPNMVLTPLDPKTMTFGRAGGTDTNSDGSIQLSVPPGALRRSTGLQATNFTRGVELPNFLPTLSHFTYACELTPDGQTFDQPVTVRMRNTRGFAPGTPIPVGIYDPDTLEWTHESMGTITADGQWAEFQVAHFSPRDCNLGRMSPTGGGGPGDAMDMLAELGTRRRNHPCSTVRGGSQIGVADGHLSVDHVPPTYRALDRQQALVMRYNSPASANPVIGLTYDISQTSVELPAQIRFIAEIGGQRVEQTAMPIEGPMAFQYRWDGRDGLGNALPAGTYIYRLTLINEYPTTFATVSAFGEPAAADTGVAADEYLGYPSTFTGSVSYTPDAQRASSDNGWGILGLARLSQTDDTVIIRDGGGSVFTFTLDDAGQYQPSAGDFSRLAHSAATGTWTWTQKDGTQTTFDAAGLQTRQADRNGNATAWTYDDAGRPTAITDPLDKVTRLAYDPAGLLASISDPYGRQTRLEHDTVGDLVGITNPDGTTRLFAYDGQHRMLSQTDAAGLVTRYAYNGLGELAQVTHADGTTRSFSTGLGGTEGSGTAVSAAPTCTDGAGNAWTFSVGAFGTRVAMTDPLGRFTGMSRNADDLITALSRPDGSRWFLRYDQRGNCTSITPSRPMDDGRIELTWDPDLDLPLTIASNITGTWEYTYDANGNVTEARMPGTATATYGYNARGQITSLAVAGRTRTFTYDGNGNIATAVDPAGHTWRFEHDTYGNLTGVYDPAGRRATATYNQMNLPTSITRGSGTNFTFSYAPAKGTVDLAGGEPLAVLTGVTDSRGNTTRYGYDAMYRMTRITDPLGSATDFAWDAAGRLASRTDPAGNRVELFYNDAWQLTRKVDNGTETVTCTYDDATGLLTQASAPACRYDFAYDDFGRLSRVTTTFLPSEQTCSVSYTHRAANYYESLVTLESGGGSRIIGWGFDGTHGPLPVQRFAGTTFNEYIEWDAAEQRTGWWNSWMTRITSHDASGRKTGVELQDTGGTTFSATWGYDAGGFITQMTAPDGVHTYAYDDAGRLTLATHPTVDNPAENYTYDPAGNRRVAGLEPQFIYDAANRLVEDPTFRYEYDAAGNLVRRTDRTTSAVTAYAYDAEHRLTRVTLPGGTAVSYVYGPLGRLVERHEGGSVTRLVYDGDEILADFDGAGTLTATSVNGTRIDDPEGIMQGGFGATSDLYYLTDPVGTVLATADDAGAITGTMRSQAFGQPVGPAAPRRGLAGLHYDGSTGLYHVRRRFYDPTTGRFLQRDPLPLLAATDPYAYAGSNPVNSRDPSGLNPEGADSGTWRAEAAVTDHIIKPDVFYIGDQAIEAGFDALEMALIDNGRATSVEGTRAIAGIATPVIGRGLGAAWSYYAETHEILHIAFSNCPTLAAVSWLGGQWWGPGQRRVNTFLTLGGRMPYSR